MPILVLGSAGLGWLAGLGFWAAALWALHCYIATAGWRSSHGGYCPLDSAVVPWNSHLLAFALTLEMPEQLEE